jgi:hypothetical protein
MYIMEFKHRLLSDAGIALAILREYNRLPSKHRFKPAYAAGLASLTAESMGNLLHTYTDDESPPFTLIVSQWTQPDMPTAVLLPKSIPNWDAAVAYWSVTRENLFIDKEYPWSESEDVERFIISSTYEQWLQTPPGSPVRWAEAARIYDESGLAGGPEGHWSDLESDKWKKEVDELQPRLLQTLGLSRQDILPELPEGIERRIPNIRRDALRDVLTNLLRDVLAGAHIDRDRLTHQIAYRCKAKPLPSHIPIEVLKNRGGLSPAQALSYYLVEQEYGPNLTYATAATLLGMNNRQEIGTHLKRARETLAKSGQKPILSGIVHSEYLGGKPPAAIEINLRSAETSGEEGRYQ